MNEADSSARLNADDGRANIASAMKRVMIQVGEELLERAHRVGADRGVNFPQLVREALERELPLRGEQPRHLTCSSLIDTGGRARAREFEPDPWRG